MIFGKSNPVPPRLNIKIPETNANIFSKLTFWWINDLMSLGYKRPLEKEDLFVLNDARTAKIVTDKFEAEWKKEVEKIALGKKPSLIKALYRVLWVRFCLAGIVRFFSDLFAAISPLILRAAPIQICIILSLLVFNIGPSALAGFALLVILCPMQWKVMSLLARTRAKAAGITDERVKSIQEILLGIRVIKYYAWEDSFADALNKLRNKEISLVRFLLTIKATITGVSLVYPILASILSFITFSLTGGNLDVEIVFSSLALFNLLLIPLMFLPVAIASISDAYVSINRINDFLQADELSVLPGINPDEQYAIKVTDGEFVWESAPPEEVTDDSKKERKKEKRSENHKKSDKSENDSSPIISNEKALDTFTALTHADLAENFENSHPFSPRSQLCNINVSIPHGKLIAIVGSVRSGKSSLLSALVGEMKKIKREVLFGGNVGYCPQSAWIQNATLRDNITFGLPFDKEKYRQVIKDCCLEQDLKTLPKGDSTEIGEKGINLSGGQKQRVNLARAVYYGADIVLLDDPLSAVDAHVGKDLFTNCIQGAFAEKTRLFVTHHLHYLPQVDCIIYMENGEIAEQGTYEELMNNGKSFSKLIAEYGKNKNDDEIKNDEELILKEKSQTFDLPNGLMSTEEQYRGTVNKEIYLSYLKNAGGLLSMLIIIFLLVMMQGTNIVNNIWLSFWSGNTFDLPIGLY
ncbi:13535_t:CDS:2, partial [Dentiscutata erythropus]